MKAEKQSQFGSESRLTRVQELKQDSQKVSCFQIMLSAEFGTIP